MLKRKKKEKEEEEEEFTIFIKNKILFPMPVLSVFKMQVISYGHSIIETGIVEQVGLRFADILVCINWVVKMVLI